MGERKSIPKPVRDRVLSEFNYRCAICAADRPQLHHIDENPENNEPLNIIPLCPNCHLTDQHNPTAPVDPRKLSLFRQYKDPAILKSQFHPIFRRLLFLSSILDEQPVEEMEAKSLELASFVATLEMGAFYGARVEKLLHRPRYIEVLNFDATYTREEIERKRRRNQEYREQVRECRNEVEALVIEQLRYQKWS
jgi:hypothetical protein